MSQLQWDLEKIDEIGGVDEPDSESAEPRVYSVSDLNREIRQILEGQFPLVWLQGEISNFKAHTSGHFYFSLKDDQAQINAVMFRGFNSRLRFRPESGMEVLVRGKITVYEPRGGYQIFCETMEPVGAGALQKAYEQLKAKLQSEGLFDTSRKRSLATLPAHVAVVTSPTGAAIRDILNVMRRRHSGVRITVVPALVQGDEAPRSLVAALALAQRLADVDVIIIGRGGGSIEDLWAFNDETLARAIAACRVPIISAVGHEVDFTIADFVADVRAPTPSAAAEMVVKSAADLREHLRQVWQRLGQAAMVSLAQRRQTTQGLRQRLIDPQRQLQDFSIRADELAARLQAAVNRSLQMRRKEVDWQRQRLGSPLPTLNQKRDRLQLVEGRLTDRSRHLLDLWRAEVLRLSDVLNSLSPLAVVERGYAIARRGAQVLTDTTDLKTNDLIHLQFARGSATARVEDVQLPTARIGKEPDLGV